MSENDELLRLIDECRSAELNFEEAEANARFGKERARRRQETLRAVIEGLSSPPDPQVEVVNRSHEHAPSVARRMVGKLQPQPDTVRVPRDSVRYAAKRLRSLAPSAQEAGEPEDAEAMITTARAFEFALKEADHEPVQD